jgi:hypothetical protein
MPTLRVGLDEETYRALLVDAERHLRPGERHMLALLRQALGLPVPLPPSGSAVVDVCKGREGRED